MKKPYIWTTEKYMKTWLIIVDIHNLSSSEIKAWKKKKQPDLNREPIRVVCDNGTVLYQLSYQAIWELVTLWVRDLLVDDEDYLFEKDMNTWLIISQWVLMSSNPNQVWDFSGFNFTAV